jgi:hypothetical protein
MSSELRFTITEAQERVSIKWHMRQEELWLSLRLVRNPSERFSPRRAEEETGQAAMTILINERFKKHYISLHLS